MLGRLGVCQAASARRRFCAYTSARGVSCALALCVVVSHPATTCDVSRAVASVQPSASAKSNKSCSTRMANGSSSRPFGLETSVLTPWSSVQRVVASASPRRNLIRIRDSLRRRVGIQQEKTHLVGLRICPLTSMIGTHPPQGKTEQEARTEDFPATQNEYATAWPIQQGARPADWLWSDSQSGLSKRTR